MDALTRRILDYVRTNPGGTTQDVLNSLPTRVDRDVAWYRMVYLQSIYEIENRGGSGRHEDVKWHILEWKPSEFYLEMASDIVKTLKNIPPRKKAIYLARRIQEFTDDNYTN